MTYGIVISSYKYGHLAAHAVESVLAQTTPFDKIWFVDDAVGDCQHIEKLYGDRLHFIKNESNLGIVDNFNNMLNLVDTDYVMFLGADNWLRPDTLYFLKSTFEKESLIVAEGVTFKRDESDVHIVTYDIMVTGELRQELYKFYSQSMTEKEGDLYWDRNGGHHGSMMYEVELAKSVGGYAHNKTSSRTDEDMNLWNKMLNAGAKVKHVNQALLYYRRHKENFNKY